MERFATLPIFAARLDFEPRSGSMAPPAMRGSNRDAVRASRRRADDRRRKAAMLSLRKSKPKGLRRGQPIRGGARLADSTRYRLRRAPGVSADRARPVGFANIEIRRLWRRQAAAPITRTGS